MKRINCVLVICVFNLYSCKSLFAPNPNKIDFPKMATGTTAKITPIYIAGYHTDIYFHFNTFSGKQIRSRNTIDIRFESVEGRKYKVYYDSLNPEKNYIEIAQPILSFNTDITIGKIYSVEVLTVPKIGEYFEVRYDYRIKEFEFKGIQYLRKSRAKQTQKDLIGLTVNVTYENGNPSISMIELNE